MATPWYARDVWQGFKWSPGNPRGHSGYDLGMPIGTPLTALLPGVVISSGIEPWGGQINILHNFPGVGDFVASYLHCSRIAVLAMRSGAKVKPGQIIGYSGEPPSTKYGRGAHCHFEISRGTQPPYMGHDGPSNPVDPGFLLEAAILGELGGGVAGGGVGGVVGGLLGAATGASQQVVHNAPGFLGICQAIDEAEKYPEFDITNVVGSVVNSSRATVVRGMVISLGLVILVLVLFNLVRPAINAAAATAAQAAPLALAAA